MRPFDDAELVELFRDDPDLLDMARAAQARDVDAPMAANFQQYLRGRLMDEAKVSLHPRGLGRLRAALGSRSGMAAAFGGAAGAVMIAVAVIAFSQGGGNSGVRVPTANSPFNGNPSVDPRTNAITVAFNEPMDQASVVRALHIVPATSFSTTWTGDTLTITPTHGLSASTAYVVRIDNVVARSTAGQAPTAPIVVAFGTQPTPAPVVKPTGTPAPTAPPVLATTVLGQTGPAADVVPAPDGRVIVTDVTSVAASASSSTSASGSGTGGTGTATTGTGSATPAATATGTSTAAATTTATGTSTATASTGPASASSSAVAPSGLVSFGTGGPTVVGAAASAAAVSPTGRYVAAVQPGPNGSADIVVENLDGSNPRHLTHADPGSPVAWTSGSAVLFTSGGHLRTVDLQGVTRGAGGPSGLVVAGGTQLVLAPGGRWAYVGPAAATPAQGTSSSSTAAATQSQSTSSSTTAAATGSLVDLSNGATIPLPGSGTIVAFAPDGSALGWVDTANALQADVQSLADQLPAAAAPAKLRPGSGGRGITALAVAPAGSRIAATVDLGATSGPAAEVRIADGAGHVLATAAENATHLTLTGDNLLAFVAGGHAATAPVPRGGPTTPASPTPQSTAVPADAQGLLDRLVAAQTSSPAGLAGLPVAGSLNLASLTPHGATQGYVIAVQAVPGGSQVTASIRLISIPHQGSSDPVTFADEAVTLDEPDGTNLVITKLTATPLSPEPAGPHVVHVAATRAAGTITVTVAFDADLDPSTVSQAISLLGPAGAALPAHVSYDATSRTATVTLPLTGEALSVAQRLTLNVSAELHDVDGNALSQVYSTPVSA